MAEYYINTVECVTYYSVLQSVTLNTLGISIVLCCDMLIWWYKDQGAGGGGKPNKEVFNNTWSGYFDYVRVKREEGTCNQSSDKTDI